MDVVSFSFQFSGPVWCALLQLHLCCAQRKLACRAEWYVQFGNIPDISGHFLAVSTKMLKCIYIYIFRDALSIMRNQI